MTDQPTIPVTMKEKLDVLFAENAKRHKDASTFLDHTHSDEGGRFAKQQMVIGSAAEAGKQYPKLPTSSPWADNPVGVEPPYDGDMSAPIVGEPHEIEASLGKSAAVLLPADEPKGDAQSRCDTAASPNPSANLAKGVL
jgi:hypothetical protein